MYDIDLYHMYRAQTSRATSAASPAQQQLRHAITAFRRHLRQSFTPPQTQTKNRQRGNNNNKKTQSQIDYSMSITSTFLELR